MKYYRMAIENIKTGKRDTYVSKHQGSSPAGWKCVGVCGYFEKSERGEHDEKNTSRKGEES